CIINAFMQKEMPLYTAELVLGGCRVLPPWASFMQQHAAFAPSNTLTGHQDDSGRKRQGQRPNSDGRRTTFPAVKMPAAPRQRAAAVPRPGCLLDRLPPPAA